jgi:hypothetical protein
VAHATDARARGVRRLDPGARDRRGSAASRSGTVASARVPPTSSSRSPSAFRSTGALPPTTSRARTRTCRCWPEWVC